VEVVVGKPKLAADQGHIVDARWEAELERLESQAHTAFLAGWDGEARGVIAVADQVRTKPPPPSSAWRTTASKPP
jgi:cation transport ATPase